MPDQKKIRILQSTHSNKTMIRFKENQMTMGIEAIVHTLIQVFIEQVNSTKVLLVNRAEYSQG